MSCMMEDLCSVESYSSKVELSKGVKPGFWQSK